MGSAARKRPGGRSEQRICVNVRQGRDRVRWLSDTPKGNRWIWKLDKDGRTVVPYDEVLEAVRYNHNSDA